MASDHDCPAVEGRLSITLARLAEKLETLTPDRQQAFRGWLETTEMESPTEALREIIRRRGLTAYRLGKDSGASVDAVQRFMNGESGLRSETFDKLCTTLGLALVERKRSRPKRGSGHHDDGGDERTAPAGRSPEDRPRHEGRSGAGQREPLDLLPRDPEPATAEEAPRPA